jgi:Cdc6-like AAA superfamily ATPase
MHSVLSFAFFDLNSLFHLFISGTNFLYCVERYRCVVLLGETGCGKTTRVHNVFHHFSSQQKYPNIYTRLGGLQTGTKFVAHSQGEWLLFQLLRE